MKKQELVVTVGLPRSGKSTWSEAWVGKYKNRVRVSRDILKEMAGIRIYSEETERLISRMESYCIRTSLSQGYSVVIDALNLSDKVFHKWESLVKLAEKDWGIEIDLKYVKFNTPVDICIARDKKSSDPVGEYVIRRLHESYKNKLGEDGVIEVEDFDNLDEDKIFAVWE